ncbi:hypothetical protein [Zobellia nedashkovskayae]|uniref:hypothetical protein n=1 Tax=Zobellia nedashkovskayae TaxID=2779510 RepID=UPI00188CB7A5|nr:hypothetical protein [Zobellia nedashkovskayae]
MKKHRIFTVLAFLLFSLSACNKDETKNENGKAPGQISYLLSFNEADGFDFESGLCTMSGTAFPQENTILYHSGTSITEHSNEFEKPITSVIGNNVLAFDSVEKLSVSFKLVPKNAGEPTPLEFAFLVFYNNEEEPTYYNNYISDNVTGDFVHEFTYSLENGVEVETNTH